MHLNRVGQYFRLGIAQVMPNFDRRTEKLATTSGLLDYCLSTLQSRSVEKLFLRSDAHFDREITEFRLEWYGYAWG